MFTSYRMYLVLLAYGLLLLDKGIIDVPKSIGLILLIISIGLLCMGRWFWHSKQMLIERGDGYASL